jgi:tRNA A-37 threonylcarbamoyl transferase component Bud32
MAIVHRIGDPENASELRAIKELAAALPDHYVLAHNLELTTGQGLPYEFDIVVIGEHAVYHVEVKGYHGLIRGDRHQWVFENGAVYPSPIPLANKKSKILATLLKKHGRLLEEVFVETIVLLSEDRARAQLRDEQASRVVLLKDAARVLTTAGLLPVSTRPIVPLHNAICEVVLGGRPQQRKREIGLYNVIEKIGQRANREIFLAEHRYLRTRPKTVLKVYHYDVYAPKAKQEEQIRAIMMDQEALRRISGHVNIVETGDFFAWESNQLVLPTEYIENGRPLAAVLDKEDDKKITWAEKRKVIAGIARGLQHAHAGGVIHRDIRPLNVVVAPGAVAKIVNFDLARIVGASDDMVPDLAERLDPAYTAPEVWRNPASASPASDVYSLGVLFFELIAGVAPYRHIDEAFVMKRTPLNRELLMKEFATPGSEDFMKHPKDAIDTIVRMCSFDPKERHQAMGEVIDDLELIGD